MNPLHIHTVLVSIKLPWQPTKNTKILPENGQFSQNQMVNKPRTTSSCTHFFWFLKYSPFSFLGNGLYLCDSFFQKFGLYGLYAKSTCQYLHLKWGPCTGSAIHNRSPYAGNIVPGSNHSVQIFCKPKKLSSWQYCKSLPITLFQYPGAE